MDRFLIAAAAVLLLSSPALAGSSDASDTAAARETYWPGMWLWSSDKEFSIHLSGGPIAEAWEGPAAYLRHHDAGHRESAARWLKALGRHALPALPGLLAVLDDENEDVCKAVEEALDAIDPTWRSRPSDELVALAGLAPRDVRIEGSIASYGFPLRGRQAVFPLEAGAEFGIEVTLTDWWGRPRPADVDVAIGDTVVFGIADPDRFRAEHLGNDHLDELEGAPLMLTLIPVLRPDGLWAFVLDEVEAVDFFVIPDSSIALTEP
jgi:hypothetical protein